MDVRSGHHHRNPTASRRGRVNPDLAKPFPRALTKKVTPPAITEYTDVAEANRLWFAWLRVLRDITQMKLPPGNARS
jgi:hypothetical protein